MVASSPSPSLQLHLHLSASCSLCFPPLPYSWVPVEKDADATDSPRRDEYPQKHQLLFLRHCTALEELHRETLNTLWYINFYSATPGIRSSLANTQDSFRIYCPYRLFPPHNFTIYFIALHPPLNRTPNLTSGGHHTHETLTPQEDILRFRLVE